MMMPKKYKMKKMIMSKKAVSANVIYWFFRILVILPIIIFVLYQISAVSSENATKTRNIESYLIEDKVFDALAYTEPNTGRSYDGMIDLQKFREGYLQDYFDEKPGLGIRVSMDDKQIHYDSEFYSIAYPLRNKDKYHYISSLRPVTTINRNGIRKQSHVLIEVISLDD